MKNFYYALFFLSVSFSVFAQDPEGIPVDGLTPIKRIINTPETTTNKASFFATTAQLSTTSTIPAPTGNSSEVGITEGQLSVSLSGGATYAIPIAVPPGINGVVPQVSLTYNSQGGNGMAGYGWNISGVSGITRIPSTKFHDNTIDPVDFNALDRFALDGQRLILKSGAYGMPGAIYETENFSNIKITSYGVHPNGANYGPEYFKVEYPDGSIAYYGQNQNQRSIMEWGISSWSNPQGVQIVYGYTQPNNILIIDTISYGALVNQTGFNTIHFVYKYRTRPEQSYIGGQSLLNTKILDKIEVKSNDAAFRSYNLIHTATSIGYQRLDSVTELSGVTGINYNPTVFTYENNNKYLSYAGDITSKLDIGNISSQNAATVSGDFGGDEKMEFLIYPTTGPDAKLKYWLYSDIDSGMTNLGVEHNVGAFETIFPVSWLTANNKLYSKQGWVVAKKTDTNYTFTMYCAGTASPIYYQYERVVNFPTQKFGWPVNSTKIFPKKILSGDFNGDGITDVIAIDMQVGTITSKKIYFIDLKRDNTSNYLTYSGELASVITSNSKVEVADVNGDGKSDFIIFENEKATTYTLNDAYQLVLLWNYPDANISIDSTKTILLGDYNGDGKTDFITPAAYGNSIWYKYSSTGSNFTKEILNYSGPLYRQNNTLSNYNYITSDFDKDGKSDLIEILSNKDPNADTHGIRLTCYYNTNGAFQSNVSEQVFSIADASINSFPLPVYISTTTGLQTSGKSYIPTQKIAFLSNNKIFSFNSNKDNTRDQLLKTITTGNGVRESITYQPLSGNSLDDNGNSIYRSGSAENYPRTDIESAATVQVVTKLEKQSASVYKKQLFAYAGATSNLEGLGFMGFSASMRTNWFENDDQIISSVSKFNPNLRGANIENYTYLGLTYPAAALNKPVPNVPRTSAITINNTRTATETVVATNSITFLPGTTITPATGNTFLAQITPDYDANGFTETNTTPSYNLISKSLSFYEMSLSATKVFKLQNVQSNNYNILENTGNETNIVYDSYNNPTESITKTRSGGVSQQTTTTAIEYDPVIASPYMEGRAKSKTQTITVSGDSMTSKETYGYGAGIKSNLLEKIEKWGHNTSAITETNVYDLFGNITTKKISASGIADRITSFKYDSTSRFLKETTDIEGFITTFDYYPNGTLQTEKKQMELGKSSTLDTGYTYDSWFRKKTVTDYLGKTNTLAYSRSGTVNTLITNTGDDGSYSEELYDELGRKIRTGVRDVQGNTSYKDYKYDIYDRNFSVSEPNSGNPIWNTTTYDVYGRPDTVKDFKGKTLTMVYDKLTTTVTDGSTGQTKVSTKNAMGNVISMAESPLGGTINYSYFANGNLKESNYNGTKIAITQDGWGRKTSLADPSAGTYTYEYNSLGESTKETTPNGTTTYELNDWGKIKTKTIAGTNTDSNTQYTYTADSKLLLKTVYTDNGDAGKTTTVEYTYNAKKQLETTTEKNGYEAEFFKKFEYDAWGRVYKEANTAKLNGKTSTTVTQNEYKNGSLYKIYEIKNDQITKTLWETKEVNARGQLTKALMGNGIGIDNTYTAEGYVTNMKHTLDNATVMAIVNEFDVARGNLNSRTNSLFGNVTENFKYDSQDRLYEYPNALGAQETQAYEDDGRIKSNALGAYNYTNTAKKYQNNSITASLEALAYYDDKRLQTVTYNTFKSPVEIEQAGVDKISFVYNDNNDRSVMFYGGLGLKNTRMYQKHYSADGSMEIKSTQNGAVEFVTYIGGDGYSAPIVYKKTVDIAGNEQEQTLYLHRDYQGSILAITNEVGAVLEKRQFDAWGAIVKVQDGAGNTLNVLTILDRGYTGHEHLQSVGLIHMNGRLYDPKLHRFLQPDNYVQDPSNTQNYNRYGYVLNNPLKYTDPSGELSLKSIGNWFKKNGNDILAGVAIVGGTVLMFVPGCQAIGGALIVGGVTHFAAAYNEYKQTGDWTTASNNAGFNFSYSQRVDWLDGNSKTDVNGVAQNEPVVIPKSDTNGGGKGKEKEKSNNGVSFNLGINSAFLGGFGFDVGLVRDAKMNWAFYFSTDSNVGLGLDYGLTISKIIPTHSGPFLLSDFAGDSYSLNAGLKSFYGVSGGYGGTIDSKVSSFGKLNPMNYGGSDKDRGYKTISRSLFYMETEFGLMVRRSKTRVYPF
jgi:RHS repeat-associated protein